jgi:glycosyltransferase involved in cell wall biosynthesis
MDPLVSVVMAVYNEENNIREAIESILSQTFTDFEFIIIDDGSNDKTPEIIKSYKNDNRVQVITNPEQLNLAASLNIGIKIAKGKYIARMDGDDISLPNRFSSQVAFMEENKDIGVCGTFYENFGYSTTLPTLPTDDFHIKIKFFHDCLVVHSSIFIRKSLLFEKNIFYNPVFRKNQDFDIFSRLISETKFSNIPKVLHKVRRRLPESLIKINNEQRLNNIKIRKALFSKLNVTITEEEIDDYVLLAYYQYKKDFDFIVAMESLILRMIKGNRESSLFPDNKLINYLCFLWENLCLNCGALGLPVFRKFFTSELRGYHAFSKKTILKLFVKCLIRK